jgi:hypothetical protein
VDPPASEAARELTLPTVGRRGRTRIGAIDRYGG